MKLITVKFPVSHDKVKPAGNNLSYGDYTYLSDIEGLKPGDLVVVPTYSACNNLKFAEVVGVGEGEGAAYERNLRYVLDIVDTAAYERRRAAAAAVSRARKLIEAAARRRNYKELYEEVKSDLSPEERAFVEAALETSGFDSQDQSSGS